MLFKSIYLKPKNVTWAVFNFSPQTCGFHVTKQFPTRPKQWLYHGNMQLQEKKCVTIITHTHTPVSSFNNFYNLYVSSHH